MARLYGNRWRNTGRQLGHGGQSVVYVVVDESQMLPGEFALKRIPNAKRHSRFRHELEAIKRIDHPNVIKIVDHSPLGLPDSADEQFIVMSIAQGGDLSKVVQRFKGSLDSTLFVAKQIASALVASHAAGVVHRDIKPGNILFVGPGNEIIVTDFGICLIMAFL